jgi:hypothetical protein
MTDRAQNNNNQFIKNDATLARGCAIPLHRAQGYKMLLPHPIPRLILYAMFAKVYIFVAFLSLIVTVNAANIDLEKRQGGESYDPYQFACIKYYSHRKRRKFGRLRCDIRWSVYLCPPCCSYVLTDCAEANSVLSAASSLATSLTGEAGNVFSTVTCK